MNSTHLLDEILVLRLRLDFGPPEEAAQIQHEIRQRMGLICTISKLPWARVKAVINQRYIDFVKSEQAKGNIVRGPDIEVTIPVPMPPNPFGGAEI